MRNGHARHANGHTRHANGHAHTPRRERAPVAMERAESSRELTRVQRAAPFLVAGAFLVGLVWSLRTLR
jgi:hypothetical protein